MGTPSPNGSNGRTAAGRFAVGNPGGPGNPHASQVASLRALLLDSVTVDDIRDIIAKLVAMAKDGDLAAIRELLDRTLGKPLASVAVGLAADSTQITVVHDENWYGNDAHARADFLDYLRQRAMEADANNGELPCPESGR